MTQDQPVVVQLVLPAQFRFLNVASACIAETLARVDGITDRELLTYGLQLAVQEVCTNVVEHAYGGQPGYLQITLEVGQDPLQLSVLVHDTGPHCFDPRAIRNPDEDSLPERGRGIGLIRQLVDEAIYRPHREAARYRSRGGGQWEREPQDTALEHNEWRLVKALA